MIAAIQRRAEGRRHFNCSDGVALPGAEPTTPDAVALAEPARPRDDSVAAIMARVEPPADGAIEAVWAGAGLAQAADAFKDRLGRAVAEIGDFTDPAHRRPLMELLRPALGDAEAPEAGAADAAVMLYRGTVMAMLVFFQYYLARVADPDQVEPFAAIPGRVGLPSYKTKLSQLQPTI